MWEARLVQLKNRRVSCEGEISVSVANFGSPKHRFSSNPCNDAQCRSSLPLKTDREQIVDEINQLIKQKKKAKLHCIMYIVLPE